MGDLAVFAALVGLFAVVGIALGILAARRLGAWDDRRAAGAAGEAGAVPATSGAGAFPATGTIAGGTGAASEAGSMAGNEPFEDGGETVD